MKKSNLKFMVINCYVFYGNFHITLPKNVFASSARLPQRIL